MSDSQPFEIYVDEVTGMMLGYPMSKVSFATRRMMGSTNPQPVPALILTMSTQTMIQMVDILTENIRVNESAILDAAGVSKDTLATWLENHTEKSPQENPEKGKKT